jgi:hypothetical protein
MNAPDAHERLPGVGPGRRDSRNRCRTCPQLDEHPQRSILAHRDAPRCCVVATRVAVSAPVAGCALPDSCVAANPASSVRRSGSPRYRRSPHRVLGHPAPPWAPLPRLHPQAISGRPVYRPATSAPSHRARWRATATAAALQHRAVDHLDRGLTEPPRERHTSRAASGRRNLQLDRSERSNGAGRHGGDGKASGTDTWRGIWILRAYPPHSRSNVP